MNWGRGRYKSKIQLVQKSLANFQLRRVDCSKTARNKADIWTFETVEVDAFGYEVFAGSVFKRKTQDVVFGRSFVFAIESRAVGHRKSRWEFKVVWVDS